MYIVTIRNAGVSLEIHNEIEKLLSGQIQQGINTIDSFSFSMLPSNVGFNFVKNFTTLVEVYNTNKNRYEFFGRVLYASNSMNESGLITKDVTCESYLGYLCDSIKRAQGESGYTVRDFLEYLIQKHNEQVESEKQFVVRTVSAVNPSTQFKHAWNYKNTWDTIKEALLDQFGGELSFEVKGGTIYLDYLDEIGETTDTEIAVSNNMRSITHERNPAELITRLIPLGAKVDSSSEVRLTIAGSNSGKDYLDDEWAIEQYGIHVGYVEWDDVTDESTLKRKGQEWLAENNKVLTKYTVTALDLSLLDKDLDDFRVGNHYPLRNHLLGIDDMARVVKKTIDVCDPTASTIELGESFKTLLDIQKEQAEKFDKLNADIGIIKRDYVTNEEMRAADAETLTVAKSYIEQREDSITLKVEAGLADKVDEDTFENYKTEAAAELSLKVGKDENDRIVSMLNAAADLINITSDKLSIKATGFSLSGGIITALAGYVGSWEIVDGALVSKDDNGTVRAKLTDDKLEFYYASGVKSCELSSGQTIYYDTSGTMRMKLAEDTLYFYDADGTERMTLTDDNLFFYDTEGLMRTRVTSGGIVHLDENEKERRIDSPVGTYLFNSDGIGSGTYSGTHMIVRNSYGDSELSIDYDYITRTTYDVSTGGVSTRSILSWADLFEQFGRTTIS